MYYFKRGRLKCMFIFFLRVRLILVNWLSRLPGLVNRLSCFSKITYVSRHAYKLQNVTLVQARRSLSKNCVPSNEWFQKNMSISPIWPACVKMCFLDTHPEQSKPKMNNNSECFSSESHLFHNTHKQSKM